MEVKELPTIDELNAKIAELEKEKRILELEKRVEQLKREVESIKSSPYSPYPTYPWTPTIYPWDGGPTYDTDTIHITCTSLSGR